MSFLKQEMTHGGASESSKAFLQQLEFTDEERCQIDTKTKQQWQCEEWFNEKIGFVTASRAKSVHSTQESIEKRATADPSSIVNQLFDKPKNRNSMKQLDRPMNPMQWGLKHDRSARTAYYRTEGRKHYKLQLVTKGFMISEEKLTVLRCKPR